ncbi:hypothetical protein PHET_04137 [Paragonimus heterotremus]|uniref:Uncharacterized protein n=1 Tax=Paragonimus heterotremus TaxID=100268 RepID=A0A8J4WZU6_9TREM|nr:hypothetical protein PHET_04137 [Paragonimus heterotremus]
MTFCRLPLCIFGAADSKWRTPTKNNFDDFRINFYRPCKYGDTERFLSTPGLLDRNTVLIRLKSYKGLAIQRRLL